ncbi:MAG: hypothetical protein ABIE68_03235 [bacterium]
MVNGGKGKTFVAETTIKNFELWANGIIKQLKNSIESEDERARKKEEKRSQKRAQCIFHIQDAIRQNEITGDFDCRRFCRCLHMATVFGSPITVEEIIPPEFKKSVRIQTFCATLLAKIAEKNINPAKLA